MAPNNLGEMYLDGKGVPQDDSEAVRYFGMAAESREFTRAVPPR